nr:MAG TPA: hypothetical protein [Caudoviricetes sp.]
MNIILLNANALLVRRFQLTDTLFILSVLFLYTQPEPLFLVGLKPSLFITSLSFFL